MTDLVAFLNARFEEDHARAVAAADDHVFRVEWVVGGDADLPGVYLAGSPHFVVEQATPEVAAHIARHDPARVLREVEAKGTSRTCSLCPTISTPTTAKSGDRRSRLTLGPPAQ